jgi:hypothetical protein
MNLPLLILTLIVGPLLGIALAVGVYWTPA